MRNLLFLSFLALVVGCNKPPEIYAPVDPSQLNSARAFQRVDDFARLGPKASNTPEAKKAAEWIVNQLKSGGLQAQLDTFEQPTPKGTGTFLNVVATLPGTTEDIIILGSHYDTKAGLGPNFMGANDSASSTGLLIEMAHFLKANYTNGPELRFLFFDGEECLVDYGPKDGLHGSRHYASELVRNREAEKVQAVIILDMIGDKDLKVTIPRNCTSQLVSLAFESAQKQGVREQFSLYKFNILDDHVPFLNAGIPAIDLIDFEYGTGPGRHDIWHTPGDNMDQISEQSLDIVGRTALEMVNGLARKSVEGE